jgi:hypothetical protein
MEGHIGITLDIVIEEDMRRGMFDCPDLMVVVDIMSNNSLFSKCSPFLEVLDAPFCVSWNVLK